jgi:hypothetical protein
MYKYQPLETGHFRLLTLLPATAENSLDCTLAHHPSASAPQYHALSYSWDGQTPAVPVRCNKETLLLTQTLHSFFLVLRQSQHLGPFWVDAVSIRQDDPAEKAAQVKVLHEYFAHAAGVYAWLGPATASLAQFMLYFPTTIQNAKSTTLSGWKRLPEHAQFGSANPGFEEIVRNFPSPAERQTELEPFLACAELLRRSWFTRLWILQEAILNETVTMFCGSHSFELDDLCTFVELNTNRITTGDSNTTIFISGLSRLKESWRRGSISPAMLFTVGLDRGVTLSVDRVYGVLGILDPLTRGSIKVDYSPEAITEPWRVFINAGHALLWALTSMNCLQVACARPRQINSNVPSWCPDFAPGSPNGAPLTQFWHYGAGNPRKRRHGREILDVLVDEQPIDLPDPWLASSLNRRMILVRTLVAGTVDVQDLTMPVRERCSSNAEYCYLVSRWLEKWRHACMGEGSELPEQLGGAVTGRIYKRLNEISSLLGGLLGFAVTKDQFSTARVHHQSGQYLTAAWARCLVGNCPLRVGSFASGGDDDPQSNYNFNLPVEELTARLENTLRVMTRLSDPDDNYGLSDFSTREDYIQAMAGDDVRKGLEYLQCIEYFTGERKPMRIFQKGRTDYRVGMGPNGMKTGDVVIIIPNANVPFVLRRVPEDEDRYILIGEAYVEGLMHGEAFRLDEALEDQDFWIE